MIKSLSNAIFALTFGSLAGCHNTTPKPDNASQLANVPTVPDAKDIVPKTSGASDKVRLLAAAEPFEGLTEIAFNPHKTKVDAAIAKAQTAAALVRSLLPANVQKILDTRMTEIQSAHAARHPADLALSAVEIYRLLVTQGAGASPVPKEVSLLDYAGFRFTADLKATPPRWADMSAAAEFAKKNWAVVKPQINSPATAAKFQAAIDNMAASAGIKNVDRGRASAKAELDLVDVLEQTFNGH